MNTQPDTGRKTSGFVNADRYARAAIAILLVTTCASAVALAIIVGPALNQFLDTISLAPSSEIATAEPGANLTYLKSVRFHGRLAISLRRWRLTAIAITDGAREPSRPSGLKLISRRTM